MKFLLGKKQDFFSFLDNINEKDKIAIITHTDLDGLASTILIEEILKTKKAEIKFLNFTDYDKGIFREFLNKLISQDITKVFVLDVNVDVDYEGFKKLKEKFDVFLIDHHPANIKTDNAIKTNTDDCATLTIYTLAKETFNLGKWEWLVCATMITDFSYKSKTNLQFIQKIYPETTYKDIYSSRPGEIAKRISSSLIYFRKDRKKVFDLVLRNKLKELERPYKIIEKEIQNYIEKFRRETEFYPDRNLYFFYHTPKFSITSSAVNILTRKEEDKIFILASDVLDKPKFVKITARNQDGREDMNLLMKEGIKGLENATGGGHVHASAAKFLKKDLEKFKENLLKP